MFRNWTNKSSANAKTESTRVRSIAEEEANATPNCTRSKHSRCVLPAPWVDETGSLCVVFPLRVAWCERGFCMTVCFCCSRTRGAVAPLNHELRYALTSPYIRVPLFVWSFSVVAGRAESVSCVVREYSARFVTAKCTVHCVWEFVNALARRRGLSPLLASDSATACCCVASSLAMYKSRCVLSPFVCRTPRWWYRRVVRPGPRWILGM